MLGSHRGDPTSGREVDPGECVSQVDVFWGATSPAQASVPYAPQRPGGVRSLVIEERGGHPAGEGVERGLAGEPWASGQGSQREGNVGFSTAG